MGAGHPCPATALSLACFQLKNDGASGGTYLLVLLVFNSNIGRCYVDRPLSLACFQRAQPSKSSSTLKPLSLACFQHVNVGVWAQVALLTPLTLSLACFQLLAEVLRRLEGDPHS